MSVTFQHSAEIGNCRKLHSAEINIILQCKNAIRASVFQQRKHVVHRFYIINDFIFFYRIHTRNFGCDYRIRKKTCDENKREKNRPEFIGFFAH